MKNLVVILSIFSIAIFGCKKATENKDPNNVLVYSSQWACSNTQTRLDEYAAHNIQYTFKEIWKNYLQEPDSVNYNEMWAKAHSIGVNNITFPLVDVKGTILINPSGEDILDAL